MAEAGAGATNSSSEEASDGAEEAMGGIGGAEGEAKGLTRIEEEADTM
jgi:hypothetical protein